MKNFGDRDFTTYPRRFLSYRWYKPLLTGLLFILFYFLLASLVNLITSTVFHTTFSVTGYDDMNFYSTAGAFFNSAMGAVYIPALLLAAFFVKDRPLSSYFSSYCSSHSFSVPSFSKCGRQCGYWLPWKEFLIMVTAGAGILDVLLEEAGICW